MTTGNGGSVVGGCSSCYDESANLQGSTAPIGFVEEKGLRSASDAPSVRRVPILEEARPNAC